MMINFMPEKYNSVLKLGNLVLRTNKKINLFHRIMFRLLLGIKVERKEKWKKYGKTLKVMKDFIK